MDITIDNLYQRNYEQYDYPNQQIKKIYLKDINDKNINIYFDNDEDAKMFIIKQINENGLTLKDLREFLE